MSLGIHRIWKKDLIQLMNPSKGKKLIESNNMDWHKWGGASEALSKPD